MNNARQKALLAMTECAIMVALSTVLSLIKIIELPNGGSVTVASMLPIVVAVYRHGWAWGTGTALVNAVIQMLLGLNNFSYFTTWQSLLALALLDYIVAFLVFALAAVFKRVIKQQNLAMLLGVTLACVLRYACHVISGATVWAGLSIPDEAALLYSLSYNATYMMPEALILIITTAYIFSVMDFRKKVPTRIASTGIPLKSAYCYIGAGLCALVAIIVDTALVFSKLQDAESAEFMITGIADVNFVAFGIVTGIAVVAVAVLVILAKTFFANRPNKIA